MCLWCVCVCVWCVAVCVLCVRPWVWRLSEGTRVSLSSGQAICRSLPAGPGAGLSLGPAPCSLLAPWPSAPQPASVEPRRASSAGLGRQAVAGAVATCRAGSSAAAAAPPLPGAPGAAGVAGRGPQPAGLARAGSPGDTAGTVNSAAVWSRARPASRRQHLPALCQPVGPLLTLQRAAGAMTLARDSPWWQ